MTNPNWKTRPLGELFDIGAGKTMSAAARAGAEKVPFLRTSNVLWDEVDFGVVDEMSMSEAELADKRLLPGDLLVCEGGEIGRAALWDGRVELMSFQNHLHRLRAKESEEVISRFYVYFLQSAFTQLGLFEGAGNKTTIPNLSRNRLAALAVPQPSEEEQAAVALALSEVRAAIDLQKRKCALLEELFQSLLHKLMTGEVSVADLDLSALSPEDSARGPERRSAAGELILYQTEDGTTRIHLRAADGTVWLNQLEMAELFQTSKQNINLHVRNVFDEGELDPAATVKEDLTVRTEGGRQVRRRVQLYRLEMVLAVGYRVRSPRGTQFRRWATSTLQEYLIKGFALDDARLKDPAATDYFEELLQRIRDIRASEKRFYQQVRDVFAATSIDYDSGSETAATFFKTIQNKLIYAVTGRTAAELIVERADPAQPHMALTTWAGATVRKADVMVSKNYLSAEELALLNRLTTMFLDFAELRASRRETTAMSDWIAQTDRFLSFNEQPLLAGAGRISHAEMEAVIARRFAEFDAQRRAVALKAEQRDEQAELEALQRSAKRLVRSRTKGKRRGDP